MMCRVCTRNNLRSVGSGLFVSDFASVPSVYSKACVTTSSLSFSCATSNLFPLFSDCSWDGDVTLSSCLRIFGTSGLARLAHAVHVACYWHGVVAATCLAGWLRPVKEAIVHEAIAWKEILEKSSEVCIVRPVFKTKGPAIVEVTGEHGGVALAQGLHGCGSLAFHNLVVLLFLAGCLKTLPGQLTTIEIHKHISNGLQVIPAALFDTKVSVNGGVAGSACETLVLTVGNMLLGPCVTVLLCQTKVDDVDNVRLLAGANKEVVRLDVPVNEVLRVEVLDSVEHLVSDHENSL
mmetsp:Transcript_68073/g.134292  ORF Transcript_68073/g.134292 Transcript_68073/m.134292 type:complete len:292 (+) Transcript_68073:383-1258(+)